MPQYSTFSQAIHDMRERGFTNTFIIRDQQVFCPDTGATLPPERLTLVEQHHVQAPETAEGERDVFGFRTEDNQLGLMTSTYAMYDPASFDAVLGRCKRKLPGRG